MCFTLRDSSMEFSQWHCCKVTVMSFVVLLLCFVVLRVQADGYKYQENTETDVPLAVTPSGSFRGSWMETRRGRKFEAYRGIRYAEAPVGDLRFQPPKLILNYDDEVDASKEGPACPLPAKKIEIDEDCLRINVYTPRTNCTEPFPVVFYIHAGGFSSMTGRSDMAGPYYLLDRDIVLVTVNYRLGSLGFISTGDALAPGNLGLKDQVAGLRWVQKNIRSFGGDPDLVTITGCSAGAYSALLHMVSPMSKGLFHRCISISGAQSYKAALPNSQYELAQKQAQILNCPQTNTSEEIMTCLRNKSYIDLAYSLSGFYDQFDGDPIRLWTPVVELDFRQERFLTMDPLEAIRKGKIHAVPYIISQTRNEFFWKAFNVLKNESLRNTMNNEWERVAPISFMLPPVNRIEATKKLKDVYLGNKKLVNDDASAQALGKLYGDAVTGFPVHRMANLMCRHSPHKVFYYMFDYIGNHSYYEDPDTKTPRGVAHQDDLIYLLSQTIFFPNIEVSDSMDSVIVDRMTAIWYNFARYGDPNPRGTDVPELSTLHWPPMEETERKYLRIGEQFTVHEKLYEDRYNFLDNIYPIEY